MVLAQRWADAEAVLLDARLARIEFLRTAIADLGWGTRVEAVHDRAEEFGRHPSGRERFAVVVARAFGPPAVTAECGAPLVAVEGVLLVSDPADVNRDADRWPPLQLRALQLADDGVVASGEAHIRRLRKVGPIEDRFPRRTAPMQRRPLW